MADNLEDGWIKWEGGKRPVDRKAQVQFRLDNPPYTSPNVRAGGLRWEHVGDYTDIIAYRVSK